MLLSSDVSWQQDNPQNPNLLNVNQSDFHLFQYVELNERINIHTLFGPNLRQSRRKLQKTRRISWPFSFRFSLYKPLFDKIQTQTNSANRDEAIGIGFTPWGGRRRKLSSAMRRWGGREVARVLEVSFLFQTDPTIIIPFLIEVQRLGSNGDLIYSLQSSS